jgi:hypothetical protein
MPLVKLIKPEFIYIVYHRIVEKDFYEFKTLLNNTLLDSQEYRDIVVDLTKATSLSTEETAVLAKTVQSFYKTTRHLKIIATGNVLQKLESLVIHQMTNFVVFTDHTSFLADCKNHA